MKASQSQSGHSIGTLNYQWAFALIHYFALQGVTQAVISPGSRSTPLALACEKHPQITTWIQIDERSAGFFALGIAQKKQQPVILICTSGSAVANWFPAVAEASHSYIPLLLLSADRPAELHNCGANQTTDQSFMFGSHVREFIALEHADETLLKSNYLKRITTQAYNKSLNQKPGPVHINIPLREPLLPRRFTADELNQFINRLSQQLMASATPVIQSSRSSASVSETRCDLMVETLNSGKGLIIVGRLTFQESQGFKKVISRLVKKLHCPILIDTLSGLRFASPEAEVNSHFIYNYDHFLQQPDKALQPDWIIQFGQFPVSKNLLQYLLQLNCHTFLVSSYGDILDPLQKANTILHTTPKILCRQLLNQPLRASPAGWLTQWQQYEQHSEQQILSVNGQCPQLFEGHVITAIIQNIKNDSLIFSGNSMAIRDFDTFIGRTAAKNKKLAFYCNRGLSGIDGNLSTFLGLLSQTDKKFGIALTGDLSFYHDMNGLQMAAQLNKQGYNALLIVVNNNGGGIFNYLPQQQLDDFDKLWNTPINLDFQHSARLYGLNYVRIETRQQLADRLPDAMSQPGIQIVEIIINQQTSVECHRKI